MSTINKEGNRTYLDHADTCRCKMCKLRKRLENPKRSCMRCQGNDSLADPFRLCTKCRNYLEMLWLKKYYEKITPLTIKNPSPIFHMKPFDVKEGEWKVSHHCGCTEDQNMIVYCKMHALEYKRDGKVAKFEIKTQV